MTVSSVSPMNSATARALIPADSQADTAVCLSTCIMCQRSSGIPALRNAIFHRSLAILRCIAFPPGRRSRRVNVLNSGLFPSASFQGRVTFTGGNTCMYRARSVHSNSVMGTS